MPTSYTARTRPITDYDDRSDFLLQEIGDYLLLEDGGLIVLRGRSFTIFTPRVQP